MNNFTFYLEKVWWIWCSKTESFGIGGQWWDETRHMISASQGRFNSEDLSCTVLVSPELIGFETEGWKGSTLSSTAQEITKQSGKQVTWLTWRHQGSGFSLKSGQSSDPLGSLLAHLDPYFTCFHPWAKHYSLTERWWTSTKPAG